MTSPDTIHGLWWAPGEPEAYVIAEEHGMRATELALALQDNLALLFGSGEIRVSVRAAQGRAPGDVVPGTERVWAPLPEELERLDEAGPLDEVSSTGADAVAKEVLSLVLLRLKLRQRASVMVSRAIRMQAATAVLDVLAGELGGKPAASIVDPLLEAAKLAGAVEPIVDAVRKHEEGAT
jgi:hypothetical protein